MSSLLAKKLSKKETLWRLLQKGFLYMPTKEMAQGEWESPCAVKFGFTYIIFGRG